MWSTFFLTNYTCGALYITRGRRPPYQHWVQLTELFCQKLQKLWKPGQESKSFGHDRTWTCISWKAVAGIEPAPLDLEMTSALLRASQPGTLPLSYAAGDKIGTNFQNCASCLQPMSIACFQTLKPEDKIDVNKDHICYGLFVDSASRPQKTTFLVSGPEENIIGMSSGKMLCET